MGLEPTSIFISSLSILGLAFLVDRLVGDQSNRYHPTAWLGKIIAFLGSKLSGGGRVQETLAGVFLAVVVVLLFALPVYAGLRFFEEVAGAIVTVIAASIILKQTFAMKTMEKHLRPIISALNSSDIEGARRQVSLIVRRDTSSLNESQLISATVESVAESTVDGTTSPLFFFGLLGVPGAAAYRAINTLDSMVGYRDQKNASIGWFSAWLDTLANFLSARLTAGLLIISAFILRENFRNAWVVMLRDARSTMSKNAGWPMAAMAGALRVKLEKPGYYTLGSWGNQLKTEHITRAVKLMRLTTLLFIVVIVIPALATTSFLSA
ncbi:MAG: cobalamin biosynthesis protein [Candidatus Bathyarchaeia archaeon]